MVLGEITAAGVAAAMTAPLMIIAIGIGIWGHRRKEAWRSVCRERELRRMLRRIMDEAAQRERIDRLHREYRAELDQARRPWWRRLIGK
jgi:hypothetical protein